MDRTPVFPDIIAHRGASHDAPENTLEALHLAGDMGAAWVETDVRVTHDDQLVMVHDFDVERTTNGSGRVSLMNLADTANQYCTTRSLVNLANAANQ